MKNEAINNAKEKIIAYRNDLEEFLKIASISTDPSHKTDIEKAAIWLMDYLSKIGMSNAKMIKTKGHPCVYAEYRSAQENAKTVLIYGHYDVQPSDPLDKWLTDPFEPTIDSDNLYCRGASDMKGQIMASVFAVDALLSQEDPPVNIKFILEGEEEIGSPNLETVLSLNKDLLKADVVLNPDAGMLSPDLPTITYGLRGLAYFELIVKGPKKDLHSGSYGGIVHNPAQAVCEIIAEMHDKKGKITIPGFYDNIQKLEESERNILSKLPVNENNLRKETGVKILWGDNKFTPIERICARPTLEINGLYSGFIDEGAKTIIPSYAMAKISTRLVPDQTPDKIHTLLEQFVQDRMPDSVEWELIRLSGSPPSITDLGIPAVTALSEAFLEIWGRHPTFTRSGGTIPVVLSMQDILGIESVLTGFGLPDDNIHGPNEKLHLPTWEKGIYTLITFFYNYASS